MNNFIIYASRIAVCLLFIGTTNAMAERRLHQFEMGESGHTVVFEMTPEEIAEDNAVRIRQETTNRDHRKEAERWVEVIEFSESGIVIEFPMNDDEIRLAKISLEKSAAKRLRSFPESEINNYDIEIVEMSDGKTLTFSTQTGIPDNCHISWMHKLFKVNYC
jgi:hypothetical protein